MQFDIAILVSALVSLVVSVTAFYIQRWMNCRGRLRIRCKLTAPHIVRFRIAKDAADNIQVNVPMTLDVYNSSYTTRAMRNVCMELVSEGKLLCCSIRQTCSITTILARAYR